MPLILSLSVYDNNLIGAGPEGLFLFRRGALTPILQPMSALYGCAVAGDRLLVAGAPHGVASRLIDGDDLTAEREWQGGWMDHTSAPAVSITALASPNGETPILLAATAGDGILRSSNRGINWTLCNFGIQEYVILSLAWGPRPTTASWLDRQVAFAGSEAGLYRSPAAGLAWKKVLEAPQDAVQALAVSHQYHTDGIVLAGTESQGLWRSTDGGRSFAQVAGLPERVDALLATATGYLAGTPEGVFRSADSATWEVIPSSPAALALAQVGETVYIGNETGIAVL